MRRRGERSRQTGMKRIVLGIVAILFIVPPLQMPAAADRGGIPLGTVGYREDAQNAIAAWNGKEEVLVLSTDLRADKAGKLLEMLPLPSAPGKISQGDRQQFKTFISLFNSKILALPSEDRGFGGSRLGGNQSSVQILFQQSIGVHNLTVAKVNDTAHFAEWVRGFAAQSGVADYSIGEEMNSSVRAHLARGICFFVFDVVEVGPELRSLDPLVYRFNTSRLYYPMEITAASYGNNGGDFPNVNLFLLVDGSIDPDCADFYAMRQGKGFKERIEFNQSELRRVSPDIQPLFKDGALAAHLYTTGGVFSNDRWKSFEDVVILRGQVRWSDPSGKMGPEDVSLEGAQGLFLTCFLPTLMVAVIMTMILFRLRKHW